MKTILVVISLAIIPMMGCSINASEIDPAYASKFAKSVRCAVGYKEACFCFIASRRSVGMTIDHTGKLCQ